MEKYLVVGLGNIGAEYAHTRHNIGFDVADAWVRSQDGGWHIDRLAEVAQLKIKGRSVLVIKPSTYMNLSGRAFRYWLEKEKIPLANTMTVVDELALPLERLRVRPSGSAAGHNGLRNIEEVMGSDAYPRLRFGIGNDFPKGRQVDYVLGRWKPEEKPVLQQKIDSCCKLLTDFVLLGLDYVMNNYNKLVFK